MKVLCFSKIIFNRKIFLELKMNVQTQQIDFYMKLAIEEAKKAYIRNSVPVGSVIVYEGKVISKAGNEVMKNNDVTAHAEIIAIKAACSQLHSRLLPHCDIYVTLEPCAMCAQAISLSRMRRLYFGAYDIKYGAIINGCKVFNYATHKPEIIGGILEEKCSEIMKTFFKEKRSGK